MSLPRLTIAVALLAATGAAAANDLTFFGYKPQAVIGKTTAMEVLGKDGPLQSVVITPSDGVTIEGIRAKTLEPGRRIRKGAKLWEVQITAAAGAQAGERSVLLKTPDDDSEPATIVLVPYLPVIQSYKVLSATGSDAAVEVELVVLDDGGKLGPYPKVSWQLDCSGAGIFASKRVKDYEQKDPKTFVIRTTLSQVGGHATGTCGFVLSVANNAGYESAEHRTTVTFQ